MGITREKSIKESPISKPYLDDSGRFIFGKYPGETAEKIALIDHAYINYLVNNREDMLESDRDILSTLLTYRR